MISVSTTTTNLCVALARPQNMFPYNSVQYHNNKKVPNLSNSILWENCHRCLLNNSNLLKNLIRSSNDCYLICLSCLVVLMIIIIIDHHGLNMGISTTTVESVLSYNMFLRGVNKTNAECLFMLRRSNEAYRTGNVGR